MSLTELSTRYANVTGVAVADIAMVTAAGRGCYRVTINRSPSQPIDKPVGFLRPNYFNTLLIDSFTTAELRKAERNAL